jgi:hypothetical protein
MGKKSSRRRLKTPRVFPYQVFVSHATADKWVATTICEKIEALGATTFRDDRDIHGGDSIPDAIRAQLKRSRELVVLITPTSWDRPWVQIEVGAAWVWRKQARIIPILYHVETDRIPAIIKERKAYNLNDLQDYLRELAKRVKEA